jgi:intraflagellar transport protein 172
VRINDRPQRSGETNKKIAYLVDLRTVAVFDFATSTQVGVSSILSILTSFVTIFTRSILLA